MASHMTLTKGQAEAVRRFLAPRLVSIDDTVKELGQEDAFRLWQFYNRLPNGGSDDAS
jgi:hypothetical protein